MKNEMAKNYNPKEFEERIYKNWEEHGAFRAEIIWQRLSLKR